MVKKQKLVPGQENSKNAMVNRWANMFYGLVSVVTVALSLAKHWWTVDSSIDDLIELGRQDDKVVLKVRSQEFEEAGKGLVASEDIPEGDIVMQVPVREDLYIGKHLLPKELAFDPKEPGVLAGSAGEKQKLVIALLIERSKPGSKWMSILESSPQNIHNLVEFDDAHRRAASASETLAYKIQQIDKLHKATLTLVKKARLVAFKDFTEAQIRWAISFVESRAHSFKEEYRLWPFFLLANHHFNVNVTLQEILVKGNPQLVQFRARQPIEKGKQIFFHYGYYGNLRLLAQFGFAISGNPILEITPTSMLKRAGGGLFMFERRLEPGGPPCVDIFDKPKEALLRFTTTETGIPELLIRCWRQSQFENDEDAQTAINLGMLDPVWTERHWDSTPRDWLEKDAQILEEIAAACKEQRASFLDEPGGGLFHLRGRSDHVSVRLHAALFDELESWNRCVDVLQRRSLSIRNYLASTIAS